MPAWVRSALSAWFCKVSMLASSWKPPLALGPRAQAGVSASGPVIFTSRIDGVARHTSASVSAVGRSEAGHGTVAPQSSSLTLAGSGSVTRTSPSCVRLLKSRAAAPWVRKSSASMARNSGSSTPLLFIAASRVRAVSGVS